MNVSRRAVFLTAGACLVAARPAHASVAAIARELRRMVGFQIIGVDEVRQSAKAPRPPAGRFIELRERGLFKETTISGHPDPPTFSEVIIFSRPHDASLRRRFPGLGEQVYHDYRLLIDGEFYHCVAWD